MNENQADSQLLQELPNPRPEDAAAPFEVGSAEKSTERQQGRALEQGAARATPPAITSIAPPPKPFSRVNVPTSGASAATAHRVSGTSTAPAVTADDLGVQDWVERAKAIVEETKDDPYAQTKKVSELRAAYQKQHYDRDLKLVED